MAQLFVCLCKIKNTVTCFTHRSAKNIYSYLVRYLAEFMDEVQCSQWK